MTQEDTLYRAFGELYKALDKDAATQKVLRNIAKAQKPESVVVTHNVCRVDSDWLNAIERGLVYIGKAIEEDRQFIRSEGEVQPIEKVRRVSRESVQHLSRHSDLITRKQQQGDLVPDKLYTVERDSDYAVYENKFLYILLLKIRDFTGVRYDAISSAYKEYRGEYAVNKKVTTATRKLNFQFTLTDEQDDTVSAPADKDCAQALERIDKILQSVAFYLRTPLMSEVSHAHKISPKITKTNVLLMNKNFREALALYEFLLAYEKDGYTIERKTDKAESLSEKVKRELAVPAVLAAFLVYEHGLGLENYLEEQFRLEEQRRREAEQNELARAIKALKKRIDEAGGNVEEYMLMLERRNAELEKDSKLLVEAQAKIAELGVTISKLQAEISVLGTEIENLKMQIEGLKEEMKRAEEEHLKQIEALKKEFEEKEKAIKAAHAEEIARLKAAAKEEYDALKKTMGEEMARLKEAHLNELNALRETHKAKLEAVQEERRKELERVRAEYEGKLVESANRVDESQKNVRSTLAELSRVKRQLSDSEEERGVLGARLTALRREYGLLTEADDFTTEAGFNALEHEFEVLGKLVREEWTGVKKMLRKEFYGGIRAAMRKPAPSKSKQYNELSGKVKKRREAEKTAAAQTAEPAPADENANKQNKANGSEA